MRKLMLLAVALAAAMPLKAETEEVGGYTWTYRIDDEGVEIVNDSGSAVSPEPSGSVVIPSVLGGKAVTRIGALAFDGVWHVNGLTNVIIPSSVTSIGLSAFGNSGLTSVTIPPGVTNIEDQAFVNCPNLTNVTFEGNAPSMGDNVFAGEESQCHVYVRRDSTGWGVDIPGTWNGIAIDYLPDGNSSATAMIANVTAKQRYPWNGKVDITYTLTGDVSAGLPEWNRPFLSVTATNRVAGTSYTASAAALSGDTGTAEGPHHIVWDLNAQGIEFKSDDVVFAVAYTDKPKPYCVIDLSRGANASTYPVSYVAEVPSDGFNTDEYKTTKLVLRLIEPGTFMMGGSYQVTLTKPFYCGVFEVTQKQYELVTGSKPSNFSGDTLPVERVSWNAIRGNSSTYNWPSSANVDSSSFVGKLQARTGLNLDLPTEAQWEYACRAGTTTTYYWGDSMDGVYCWYSGNSSSTTHPVGMKMPNAWGLYDMSGNIWEWCLDWYGNLTSGMTDPIGSSSGSYRVGRGGSWNYSADNCTSSGRINYFYPSFERSNLGFRLVRTLSSTNGERSPEAVAGAERADTLCAAEAASVAIDSRVDAEPVLGSVVLPWDAAWIGGDTNATVVISDNDTEVRRTTDVGEFTYTLTSTGRHELTYTTYIGGVAQDEVYTATVYKDWKYEVVDGGAVITETTQTAGDVTIPAEIDGYAVKGIANDVFRNCTGLMRVTVPESVTSIGTNAFAGCSGLMQISLPGRFDFGNLPDSVFAGCPAALQKDYSYTYLDIVFDVNGGETGEPTRSVAEGAMFGELPNATREGYSFVGWYTERNGGVQITATDRAWSSATYHAHWKINQYMVTFNANGGLGWRSESLDYGSDIVAPVVTRPGHVFTGWSPDVATTVPASNVTYTAHWRRENYDDATVYQVNLDANIEKGGYFLNGSVSNATATAVVACGEAYNLPTPINGNDQREFVGWCYVDPVAGTTNALPSTVPLRSFGVTNLVALWMDGLAAALNADGTDLEYVTGGRNVSGYVDMEDVFWTSAENDGERMGQSGELPTDSYDSYTYIRTTLPGPGVLTYRWRIVAPVGYYDGYYCFYGNCIRFVNAVGNLVPYLASGEDVSSTEWRDSEWQNVVFTNNSENPLTVEWRFVFCNDGYAIGGGTGWVDNVTWTPAGMSPVTLDACGGTVEATHVAAKIGNTLVSLPKPVRPDYQFTGWYTDSEGGDLVRDLYVVPADITLYAHWRPLEHGKPGFVVVNGELVDVEPNGATTIVVPEDVTRIASQAFMACSHVQEISLPVGVTNIGVGVFANCKGLSEVILPDSVTNIDAFAFYGCDGLVSVLIPTSVVSIGDNAFQGCANLKQVSVPQCVFSSCLAECFPDAYTSITNVTATGEIHEIADHAFAGCGALVSVTISGEIERIGNDVFSGCTNLQLETFCEDWGGYRLFGGWVLGHDVDAELAIPNIDRIIGVYQEALKGCTALRSLSFGDDSRLVSIGDGAFSGCTELKALVLPPSLETIGAEAFMGCSYLENVIVPGSAKSVGARAFKNCTGLTAVRIEHGVESLDDEVFYGDWRLTEIDIPSSVGWIGFNAFGGDSFITKVSLRGDIRPLSEIFASFRQIETATVKVGEYAVVDGLFGGCSSLESVRFLGNCPALVEDGVNLYSDTPASLVTYVEQDSTGWDGTAGSHALPMAWPLQGTNRRPIEWWVPSTYLVRFDSNGGSGEMDTQTFTIGEEQELSVCTFEYPGHTFAGWATNATGDVVYTSGLPVLNLTAQPGGEVVLYAVWEDLVVTAPVVTSASGTAFFGDSCEVALSCTMEGATIYYSTNGTTPRLVDSYKYTAPFTITDTTTIKAVAVLGGVKSEYVRVTITKQALSLAVAASADATSASLPFTTGGNADWTPISDTTAASGLSAQSGTIGDESETWIQTSVSGAGTFSFQWKVDCEWDDSGDATWDHLAVFTNGVEVARLDGTSGWIPMSLTFADAGTHTIRWTFVKDGYDEEVFADHAWVSGVTWTPRGSKIIVDMGGGKSVAVPQTWIEEHPALVAAAGGDAGAALASKAANGRLSVVECYVLGLDPESTTNDFKITSFPMKADGTPDLENIVFDPPEAKWNVEGARPVVKGAASLGGEWQVVTEENKSGFRFFKVEVVLP